MRERVRERLDHMVALREPRRKQRGFFFSSPPPPLARARTRSVGKVNGHAWQLTPGRVVTCVRSLRQLGHCTG